MTLLAALASYRTLERLGLYALVAAAVLAVSWVVMRQLQIYGLARGAELDDADDAAGGMKNGVTFFIARGALLQLGIAIGIVVAGLALAILTFADVLTPGILLGAAVGGFFAGCYAPRQWFAMKAAKRAEAFQGQMLEFVMGLANGLKAGQALPQALEVYARNAPEPLKGELRVVQREYHLGIELSESLFRMYRRIPCEDLQLLIVSIRLTLQSGGSLAQVLDKMTNTIRARNEFDRKLKALTAQGRFEALAMSCAPIAAFFILLMTDRELVLPLVTTGTGWIGIGIDVVLVSIGYSIIRQIVKIEV